MTRLRALVATITVCALCACLWPTTIQAQEIIDPWEEETIACGGEKQDVLSRQWILQKVDCGADWAVKALINKGTSILTDVAKDLLSAAVAQFIPGLADVLGSLFGGGGGDPFAKHVQTILDHIDKATAEIIDNAVDIYRTDTLAVDIPGLLERLLSYNSLKPGQAAVLADSIRQTEEALNETRIELQRDDVYGVQSLHYYMTVVGALLEAESMWAFATSYSDARQAELDIESPGVLQQVQNETERLFTIGIDEALNGTAHDEGVFGYLASLSDTDAYRRYSDQRFSEPTFLASETERCGNLKASTRPRVVNEETWEWEITEDRLEVIGKPVKRKYRWTHTRLATDISVTRDDTGGHPHAWIGCPIAGSFRIRLVEHVEGGDGADGAGPAALIDFEYYANSPVSGGLVKTIGLPTPTPSPEVAWQIHRDWAYEDLVLSSYGAARPIIDEWWELVNPGQERPILDIDHDLEEFVTGANTSGVLSQLSRAFPSGMDDETLRWAINLILVYGRDAVETAAYGVELIARNQDPHGLSGYARELARAKAEYEHLEEIKAYVTELQRRQAAYEYRVKIRNYVTALLRAEAEHEAQERLMRKRSSTLHHLSTTILFL